jgi:hypothetical protein
MSARGFRTLCLTFVLSMVLWTILAVVVLSPCLASTGGPTGDIGSAQSLTCNVNGCVDTDSVSNCQEDEPCWNWVTMGNGTRGVVTMHGVRRVVNACTFKRYMRNGNLAYSVTIDGHTYRTLDRMKGDRTAMRATCAR